MQSCLVIQGCILTAYLCTQAHDHAKAAADATQTSNSTVAINEHTLAAGEFSNAAKATSSVEALRTLRLLEQHHQKLSELIKFSVEHPAKHVISEKDDAVEPGEKASTQASNDERTADSAPPTSKPSGTIPSLASQRRYPPRELSSSIASNLASARGIRSSNSRYRGTPVAPSISSAEAPGNVDTMTRKDSSRTKMQHMLDSKTGQPKPSWVPPSQSQAQSTHPSSLGGISEDCRSDAPSPTDEGFSRFYSSFGSLINRLSAPLAFAGLPLISEESAPAEQARSESPEQKRHRGKSVSMPSDEPNLSSIYSRAALGAVYRDGHSGTDSFYVVPTSGHTVSYANILNFDQKERRRAIAASVHSIDMSQDDKDDFVDARESQVPLSSSTKRRVGKSQSERELLNVIEELNTENASLKDMLDKIAKRLQVFEASAQHSRLAIVDSMRLPRPGSPMSQSGGPQVPEELAKRNSELEEELARASKEVERVERERAHLQHTVDKYRVKWETLKAGAKARREATKSADT